MANTESLKLSIIVPVYNEEKTILTVLQKLHDLKRQYQNIQIVVINDGSKDNTQKILNDNNNLIDKLINNETNKGKGYSVTKGLHEAEGKYIIFQDGDLEYDPADFVKFFKLINNFEPDLILGSLIFSTISFSENLPESIS